MKHKIKMVGFDLDGTLLTSDKRLTDYTKEVLERAAEQGVLLIPMTGRPLAGLPKAIREFPQIRYAVTSNGARILDLRDERALFEQTLSKEKAEIILEILGEYDTLREIYYCGRGYAESTQIACADHYIDDPAMVEYVRTTRTAVKDIMETFYADPRGADKIQGLFADMEEKDEAWKRISEAVDAEVTGALKNNIEIMDAGINKGNAVHFLAEYFGISIEETMTFGDGGNDVAMLNASGIAVGMANGVPAVHEAADIIAECNDADGVAKIIEKYILE